MSEDGKPDSKWEEAERLGPYQLHEQVPGSAHPLGELFRATHETSGVTALVLKPAAKDEAGQAPLPNWQVRCISSSDPRYIAMEVESSPWSHGPDKHSVEELLFMHEGLREGMERMARPLSSSHESRPQRRLRWGLAGAVAVCALVFWVIHLTRMFPEPVAPDFVAGDQPAPMRYAVPTDITFPLTDNYSFVGPTQGGPPGFFLPFPRQPLKAQKRPPCISRVEVEINGGCWVPHQLKAPCPEQLYEHQGQCYTASLSPPQLPQSVGP